MIDNWEDITLGMFQELMNVNELNISSEDKILHNISILSEYTYDELLKLPQWKVFEMVGKLEFMSTPPKTDVMKHTFKFEGVTLKYNYSPAKISTKQYMDVVELNKNQAKSCDNLHIILAVLAEVDVDDVLTDVPEFIQNHIKIGDALAISNFFFAQYAILTHNSLEMEKKKLHKEMENQNLTPQELTKMKALEADLEYSQLLIVSQMSQN